MGDITKSYKRERKGVGREREVMGEREVIMK